MSTAFLCLKCFRRDAEYTITHVGIMAFVGLPVAIDRAVMLPHEFRDLNGMSSMIPRENDDSTSTVAQRGDSVSKNTAANTGYPFPHSPEIAHMNGDSVGPRDMVPGRGGAPVDTSLSAAHDTRAPEETSEAWKQPTLVLSPVAET